MDHELELSRIKKMLRFSMVVLILGGIALLVVAITEPEKAILGGAIGWGAGVGTAMHACALRLIALLEAGKRTPSAT